MMPMTDHSYIALSDREQPVLLAWPTPGNAGGFIQLEKAADWRVFVESLGIWSAAGLVNGRLWPRIHPHFRPAAGSARPEPRGWHESRISRPGSTC